jgi:hypothetical protein
LGLGNIDKFITRRISRKKESSTSSENNSDNRSSLIPKSNWIIIVIGIIIAAIGFAGTIYYGSQFVKEEVNAGGEMPYINPSHIKNVLPIDLEIDSLSLV